MKLDLEEKVVLPEGVTASISDNSIILKGPKGEVARSFHSRVSVSLVDKVVVVSVKSATKREKCFMNTFISHVKNIVYGVVNNFSYELKICSGHFPINVGVNNNGVVVKNFLGENAPRTMPVPKNVQVKVFGDRISVVSPSIELAGSVAGRLEILTGVGNRDRRRFQDGIFIVKKGESK